ncbi:chemotaxis-specific protein-glutamate methyltransferase CheB [Pseudoduganella sp. DS3]|uniref:Protein-glutamate methylesterase/protein-glutamine glutaminase n=1 Tax=Pseudoduganella guangdongensis TaxID=2692179 RepID=A0A6N9HRT1_9BURK|nr:chemotaxis response regulator protein-glutamate methylesterase [Pseudoduganella guangdongensis]MYN05665.1 chemotaxis-specific protein-glutamate methyltransferase CheB [Pseudoduganella guangdongensis]
MKQIKVMVVDDSAVVRQVLSGLLGREPDMQVTYAVADPILASERMRLQWPDVVVLDIEMPRMDGITFLRKIMAERPTPVVICSSLTEKNTRTSMDALAAGAVAVVCKPRMDLRQSLHDGCDELVAAVRSAAQARLQAPAPVIGSARPAPLQSVPGVPAAKLSADAILPPMSEGAAPMRGSGRVVALGTSTGGTQALERVLTELTPAAPGIVIVQHMPEQFTAAFAERLNSLCQITVREARNNDPVLPGQALIAPGGRHMLLRRGPTQYFVEVVDGPLVNRHRPSVDVLFRSVAKCAGASALGIIMTGMGDDGAVGLLEMRQSGARTLAQDEQSCVVYGMPREAVKRGAAERSVALDAISREILQYGSGERRSNEGL